jgi:Tol biopolymer transport system component/DNA-binding winged helix-turn-helix (wHTH) protein
MSFVNKHLYQFKDFRLDTKEKILMRDNESVSLTPKMFEMLSVLVENHGKLIQKEELMKKIWADSFVEESNLTFNIRQLRKVLGDDAQNPTYIKTVPRHGYRFIAPVVEITEEQSAETTENLPAELVTEDSIAEQLSPQTVEQTPDESKQKVYFTFFKKSDAPLASKSLRSALPVAALLIVFITLIAAASWVWRKYPSSNAINAPILATDYKSEQLTNAGGVFEAVISPDGRMMAYASAIGDQTGIWLRQFETGENSQILPNTADAYYGLAFSKDSRELYFSRGPKSDEARQTSIYKMSVFGGIPKETVSGIQGLFSLSPDNRQISFVRCARQDEDFCSLFVADIDGQNERKLLTKPRPIRIVDNQFAPDGKSIAAAVGQSRSSSSEFGLIEVDVETGAERNITEHKFSVIKYLHWLPDKSGILLTAFEPPNNSVKIFQVSNENGEYQVLTKDAVNYDGISLDNAARKMVATQITANFRLWTAPISEPNNAKPISQAAQPMYYGQSGFVFAPNEKIVYASAADSNQHIWIMNADGTDQRQLTSGQGANWQPRLSPDQNYILFASNRAGSSQIWRMNTDGSNQMPVSDAAGIRPIFVSSDGNTIYYEVPHDSTLGKMSVGKDGKISSSIISNERMFQPEINTAENTVVYFSRQANRRFEIALMSLADGKIIKSFPLADEKALPIKIVWSPDGKSLFYLISDVKENKVWQLQIETGKTEQFANLGDDEISDFAIAPNGKSFAYIRGKEFHDAFLIEGLK